ncbi:MAG: ABC transporter substrate-binding protein [Enterobacteriaceae bacterium]
MPDNIKQKGIIIDAIDIFPPFAVMTESKELTGVNVDFAQALSELLGVKIEHQVVNNFSSLLTGIQAERYTLSLGPVGDHPDRHAQYDFIDMMKEATAFAVRKGNPAKITSLTESCGKTVSVVSGGSGEQTLLKQAKRCTEEGKPALTVQVYPNNVTSILAVRSKRSDAAFGTMAPLAYFVQQSNDELEMAGVGQDNGFGTFYLAFVLPKDSKLTPVILEACQQLFNNGTYATIIKKWGLERNMIPAPGLNLAAKETKK